MEHYLAIKIHEAIRRTNSITTYERWKYYTKWKKPDKRPHITWFHLYKIPKICNSTETKNRLVVVWDWDWRVEMDKDTKGTIYIRKKRINLNSSKLEMFAPQKTLLKRWEDKIQDGRIYLQTTDVTKDPYLEYTKKYQNSTWKKKFT